METITLVRKCEAELARLKKEGWTQKDFAEALAKLLDQVSYAEGDACPECGDMMMYEKGCASTFIDPGEEPAIWCECGACFGVDWSREEMKKYYEPEFIDPKDDGQLTLAERNR
jgi:hypothetical protein